MMDVLVTCPFCGNTYSVTVDFEDFFAWKHGLRLAQNAFPYLTPDERELLISGICPECWEKMFGEEDE